MAIRRFSRSGSRRRSSSGRAKEWIGWRTVDTAFNPVWLNLVPGQAFYTWMLPPNFTTDEFDEPTVLRIDFWMTALMVAVGIPGHMNCWAGIIPFKARDDTDPIPTNEVPLPWGNSGSDWLRWFPMRGLVTAAVGGVNEPGVTAFTHEGVTIKTRRKLENGMGLAFVFHNESDATIFDNHGVNFAATARILLANR